MAVGDKVTSRAFASSTGTRGERAVREALESRGFWCDTVEQFELLVYQPAEKRVRHYRVDFFVSSLGLLIEFDGAQHFRDASAVFRGHSLVKQRERDLDVDAEARRQGLHLLRIPHSRLGQVDELIGQAVAWILAHPDKLLSPAYEYYE